MGQEVAVVKTVSQLLSDNSGQLAKLLPRVITPQRFASVVVNVIANDEKLQACTATSLVRCIFQSAQLGLTPGLRRQSYLVPFKNNKKNGIIEAQLLIGYQGLLDMARRSGEILKIDAKEVLEGDIFRYTEGYDDTLVHEPISEHRNEPDPLKRWAHVIACYAFAKLKNGEHQKVVLTKQQIEGHRDQWSKAKDSGPWITAPIEMALKTALRELTNLLPSADEAASLAHAYALDTQAQLGQDQTFELTDFTVDDEPAKPAGNGTSTHTNPLKPTSPILPNFGPNHAKAKPVDHPDVTLEDLDFFLGVKEKDLGKAGRERFHNDDVVLIAAIKTEIARRKSQQDTDKKEPAKPASTESKPTESKPNTKEKEKKAAAATEQKTEPVDTRTAPTQDEWSRWVTEVSMTHPAQFKQLKAEFKVNSSDKLPNASRLEFRDKMMILIAEATVPTETAEPQ